MSEKLEQCRSDLCAAIRRALEGPPTPRQQTQCGARGQDAIARSIDLCGQHVDLHKPLSSGGNAPTLPCTKPDMDLPSEAFHPSLHDYENLQHPTAVDVTQDLLDIIESTSSSVIAEILQNLDRITEVREDSLFSLDLTAEGATESVPGDDGAIEMVLDLEDEYSIVGGAEKQ